MIMVYRKVPVTTFTDIHHKPVKSFVRPAGRSFFALIQYYVNQLAKIVQLVSKNHAKNLQKRG